MKRRVWPWILLALLLLLVATMLMARWAPSTGEHYGDAQRVGIVVLAEAGWLMLVVSAWRILARGGAGLVGRLGRFAGGVVVAAGLGVAVAGGWLVWEALGVDAGAGDVDESWD